MTAGNNSLLIFFSSQNKKFVAFNPANRRVCTAFNQGWQVKFVF